VAELVSHCQSALMGGMGMAAVLVHCRVVASFNFTMSEWPSEKLTENEPE
jgi:hypothetical protein